MKKVLSGLVIGLFITGMLMSCGLAGTKLSETKVYVDLGEDVTIDAGRNETYKDFLLLNNEIFLRLSLYSTSEISTLQKLKDWHSNHVVVDEFKNLNGSFGVIYTFPESDDKRLDAYYKNKEGQWIEIESDLNKIDLDDAEIDRAKAIVDSMKSVSKSSKKTKKKKKK